MTFINQGDSLVYVGDLLNLHGGALDDVFERVFRSCINGVNLQHFNRNQLVDTDFIQFTLEHTDFVDYVFSSRNVKFSDHRYEVLVGGVINWLNNLAQSNRQMDVNNDWAISLQVSRTSEIPRGFGEPEEKFEPEIVKGNEDGIDSLSIQIPRLRNEDMDILPGNDNEEERMFGSMSGDDEDNDVISKSGEDIFEEDDGTFNNNVYKNKIALDVFIDKEIRDSNKITDYYELGEIKPTDLRGECLLIAIFAHHVYLTQPKNFKRIMYREGSWITPKIMSKLIRFSSLIKQKFGENISGRGHWDEISYMHKLFANDSECFCLTETPKNVMTKLRQENSNLDLNEYPMYVLMHCNSGQNKCKIERLFSCGDDGIFSNDRPCVYC